MANVSMKYMDKLEVAAFDDLVNPVVFVIDMINGFTKDGALSDRSILEIVGDIKELLKQTEKHIFVCDSHDLNAKEFDSYPIHCIENTDESKVIKELKKYEKNTILKNSTNTFVSQGFQDLLPKLLAEYDDYVIVGCCTDICIMQFALSFQTFLNEFNIDKKRIIVPVNMVETFHNEGVHDQRKMNETALDFLLANGIHVIDMR